MFIVDRQRTSLDSISVKTRIEATLSELENDSAFTLNSTFDKVMYLENLCSSLNRLLDHCPPEVGDSKYPERPISVPSSEDDDSYTRVCHMLEHLISDASDAVRSEPKLEDWEDMVTITCEEVQPSRKDSVVIPTELGPSPFGYSKERRNKYLSEYAPLAPILSANMYLEHSPTTTVHLHSHSKILVSMAYWVLLFVLGVVLLDRYLCELSSQQVASALDLLGAGQDSIAIDMLRYEGNRYLTCQRAQLKANLRKALFRRKSL